MDTSGSMETPNIETGNIKSLRKSMVTSDVTVPPVFACDIKDLNSFNDIITKLSDTIVIAVSETKNVTSNNKKLIKASAEEVKKALNLLPIITATSPSTQSLVDLKNDIKDEFISLRNEIDKLKNTSSKSTNIQTYAEITKKVSQTPTMPTPRKPSIIIKSSDPETKDVMNIWKKNVTFKTQKYAPNNVYKLNNKTLKVEFETKQQCEETMQRVKNTTGIEAEEVRLKRPLIILKGISKNTNKEELLTIIACQNSVAMEDMRLCYTIKNRNDALYNAVLEVTPDIRKQFMSNSRVNIDHQRVHFEDHSRFVQCYKCLQYGHTKTKCNSDIQPCSHCASQDHTYAACPHKKDPTKLKCYNCSKGHNGSGNKEMIKHSATSIKQCPKIIITMSRIEQQIDYGL